MRREIHQEPELGLDLPRTRATVLDGLSGLDLEINQSQATTGLVAILRGARPGPNVLLRGMHPEHRDVCMPVVTMRTPLCLPVPLIC